MRCPVCRADNTEGPECRRCRADLSLLFALESQRARLLAMASDKARQGKWHAVTWLAQEAHDLRQGSDSERILAVAWLMRRDFAKAWEHCRAAVMEG
jgi:hypothetical protein